MLEVRFSLSFHKIRVGLKKRLLEISKPNVQENIIYEGIPWQMYLPVIRPTKRKHKAKV